MRFLMPRERYTTAWRRFSSIDTKSIKALTSASFTLKKEHSTMSHSRWAYHSTLLVFAFALTTTTGACVTKGTCDKKIAELDRAAGDREKDLKAQVDRLQKHISEADEQINALMAERDELRKKADNTTAMPSGAASANSLRRHSLLHPSARSHELPPRLAPPLGR
jgi:septal ring factor EnvC (AmiA/AmiB activator)